MVLRIERLQQSGVTIFSLSGNLDANYPEELERLFDAQPDGSRIVVDLSDIRLVNHPSVLFLARCTARGIELQNCPVYVREWINREKELFEQSTEDESK